MARKSKKDKKTRYAALRRGLRKHFPRIGSMIIAGVRYTPEELVARVDLLLADHQRTYDAFYAWQAALAIERRHEKEARDFLRSLDEWLAGAFGRESAETKAMGVRRRKTGPKTLEGKVVGARKAAATRALRGTSERRRRR